jgi:hypothetical protein
MLSHRLRTLSAHRATAIMCGSVQNLCTPACPRDIPSDLLADNPAPTHSSAPASRILKCPWFQHRVMAEFALRLRRTYVSPHSSTEALLQQYHSIRSWFFRGQCPGLRIFRFNRTSYTLSRPSIPDVLE